MKIEKNIEAPKKTAGRPAKYPFADMDVGDSVFIHGGHINGKEYVAASQTGLRKGWKFSGRSVDGGLRIWRVE